MDVNEPNSVASPLPPALGCRGEPALNFLVMLLLFSQYISDSLWESYVFFACPSNVFLWQIFWLHIIYTFLHSHFPYPLHNLAAICLGNLMQFFFNQHCSSLLQDSKSCPTSELAPSMLVLTRVTNPMSWESTLNSMNCFLCSLISIPSPSNSNHKIQSQGYFPDFCPDVLASLLIGILLKLIY